MNKNIVTKVAAVLLAVLFGFVVNYRADVVKAAFPLVLVDEGCVLPPCPANPSISSDDFSQTNVSTPPCPANPSISSDDFSQTNVSTPTSVFPKKGDGWYSIAQRYGCSVNDLLLVNNSSLNKGPVYGQAIKLPSVNNLSNTAFAFPSEPKVAENELICSVTLKNKTGTPSWSNATHAARILDGLVLAPNKTFSWATFVGPCGKADGFILAPVYPEGEAYGGGVCFTSTVIHQAAKKADMQILERHTHSKRVAYAEPGSDASVSYGSWDNRFKNTYDFPVKFVITYDDSTGKMTAEVYKVVN